MFGISPDSLCKVPLGRVEIILRNESRRLRQRCKPTKREESQARSKECNLSRISTREFGYSSSRGEKREYKSDFTLVINDLEILHPKPLHPSSNFYIKPFRIGNFCAPNFKGISCKEKCIYQRINLLADFTITSASYRTISSSCCENCSMLSVASYRRALGTINSCNSRATISVVGEKTS